MMMQNNKRGFTILELLIVMGIIVVLAGFGSLSLSNYRAFQELELVTREIALNLRDAQQKSITQEDGFAWGLRLNNVAGDNFQIIQESSPPSFTVVTTKPLGSKIVFGTFTGGIASPLCGASPAACIDIRFSKITGAIPEDVVAEIKMEGVVDCAVSPDRCRKIKVAESGTIEILTLTP